jgi:hypothetical protein
MRRTTTTGRSEEMSETKDWFPTGAGRRETAGVA